MKTKITAYDHLVIKKYPWLLPPRKLRVDVLYDSPAALDKNDVNYFAGVETEDAAYEIQWALEEIGHSVNIYAISDLNFSDVLGSLTGEIIFNQVEEDDLGEKVLRYAETFHRPITGVDSRLFRTSWDKIKIKKILLDGGIPTPWYQIVNPQTINSLSSSDLPFPLIVKSADDHGSKSITRFSVVHDIPTLKDQVNRVKKNVGGLIMVEQYIRGRELAATVIGNTTAILMPLKEILFGSIPQDQKIVTYENKWMGTEPNAVRGKMVRCPARLSPKTEKAVTQIVLSAYKKLNVRDYARFDLRLDGQECYVIDFNTNPAIAYDSSFRISLETFGLSYPAALNAILAVAWERYHNN